MIPRHSTPTAQSTNDRGYGRPRRSGWLPAAFWTVVVCASLSWNLFHEHRGTQGNAVAHTHALVSILGHGGLWLIGLIGIGVGSRRIRMRERESEQVGIFMQTVIDGVPDALMVINRDHTIALANRTVREMAGGEDPVAACLECHQVSHESPTPCEATEHPCPLEQVVATKTPVAVEHIHHDAEGHAIAVEVLAAPIFDEAGEVVRIIESCRDVTERKRAEEQLQFLSSITQQVKDSIIVTDTDFKITYINKAAEEMFGYSEGEIQGQTPDVLNAEPVAPHIQEQIYQAVASGEAWAGTHLNKRKNGSTFVCELKVSPLVDTHGRITAYAGIQRDVTERKRAEEALRESESLVRNIVEHSTNLFYSHGPDHVLTYLSPRTRDFFDCEPEEAMKRWTGFATDNPLNERGLDITQRAIETGERQPPYELELIGEKGRKIMVEVNETPVVRDGQTIAIVGALTDITERKRAEEALQQAHDELEERVRERTAELADANQNLWLEVSERQQAEESLRESRDLLQAVIDGTNDNVLLTDLEGRFRLLNAAAARVTGKSVAELLGKSNADIFSAEDAQRLDRQSQQVIETGEPLTIENALQIGGATRWFLATKTPQRDASGEITGVITVSGDITELRQAREQLQRSQRLASIGTLAAGIAHEINNPVGGILLSARSALDEIGGGQDREYVTKCLSEIADDAKRCGRIIQGVLRFSRQQPTERSAHDVNDLVRRSLLLTRESVRQRGGLVDLKLAPSVPTVSLNPTEMEQVIVNLIQNAMDAGGPGTRITIGTAPGDGVVRLTVADDGPGMSPEQLEHIFDPFYTTRQQAGGTGLGLSVVHGIVEAHGGSIKVESELGCGTTFSIELPRQRPAAKV